MAKKKNKVIINVPFWIRLARIPLSFYWRVILGYKQKSKYKIKKGESAVVLSNHQTDLDGLFLHCNSNKFLYVVATDNIFNKKNAKFLKAIGAFPKRKGLTDLASTKEMVRILSHGGNILLFPEGNRSYAEFQFFISGGLAGLIRKFKSTIVLHNIHGGFGVNPRFGGQRRKGPFYGEVKRVLTYEDYKDMSDEEITQIIKDELKVYDYQNGFEYKSDKRAEYLERMFFVCPKCGSVSSLVSQGNIIKCRHCDLEVEYTTHLGLESKDPTFKYKRLVDWYDFERKWVKDYIVKENKVIFSDDNVTLFKAIPFEEKIELATGRMILNDKSLSVGNVSFKVKDIEIASPVSGRNLVLTIDGIAYQIKGDERFNALKYVFMFNRLDTIMKDKKTDNYYPIEGELNL